MLVVTKNMRAFAEEKLSVAAGSDDNVVREAISKGIADGTITMEKMIELSKQEEKDSQDALDSRISSAVTKTVDSLLDSKLEKFFGSLRGAGGDGASADASKEAAENLAKSKAAKAYADAAGNGGGAGGEDPKIRVKKVIEQFDDTKSIATYAMSQNPRLIKSMGAHTPVRIGVPGQEGSHELYTPTQRQKAIAGAWLKYMLRSSVGHLGHNKYRMTELDWKLVEYAAHECKFVGGYDVGQDGEASYTYKGDSGLMELHRKAVLDEASGSQGLEAVPIEFDDAAILTPLLTGELFPFVTVRNVNRRRIEGFSMSNVTVSFQAQEQTQAIPLFTTTAFIAAFDTNISVVNGAIEIGIDFAADSPVAIGEMIIDRYGQAFLKKMDDVIASGSGSGEPLGIINTSGAVTVNSANDTTGPATIGDYEGLLFGVTKEYRQEAGVERSVFLTNETTYARMRGIPVGDADERRLFGMDHESYRTLSHPHKINETLGNSDAAFACLNRYRMYRRAGFSVRVVTEDADLARNNKELILFRSRWGGQMELGGAVAVADDFKS